MGRIILCWVELKSVFLRAVYWGGTFPNSVTHLERVLTLHDNKERLKFLKLTEFGVFLEMPLELNKFLKGLC